jgi:hypothetical protein
MYNVELSDAALSDLREFDFSDALEIIGKLQTFEDNPKPAGIRVIPIPEAIDGVAYFDDTAKYSIVYNIFETIRLVKVVAIFKKIYLN